MQLNYKALVTSLGYGCPCGEEIEDCVLREFKKLPPEERRQLAYSWSHAKLKKIYEAHRRCLAVREGKNS